MSIQRVGSSLLKYTNTLTKSNQYIPAFQLQKSTAKRTSVATSVETTLLTSFTPVETDHFFKFYDGDIVDGTRWVYGDGVETTQTIYVSNGEQSYTIPASQVVVADTGESALAEGDYAIYAKFENNTASLVYSSSFTKEFAVDSDTSLESGGAILQRTGNTYRLIGGFHYSPFAPAYKVDTGGAQVKTVNQWSIWDLHYRPAAPDPRGMTSVNGGFWVDIYLTASTVSFADPRTGRHGATLAVGNVSGDGSMGAVIHPTHGYDLFDSYTHFRQGDAAEMAGAFGKRLLTTEDFYQAAVGTTEEESIGGSSPSGYDTSSGTGYKFTSQWGAIGVSGVLWQWGHFSSIAGSWTNDDSRNRGQQYYNGNGALLLGGYWGSTTRCGSRCVILADGLSYSATSIGSRFASNNH